MVLATLVVVIRASLEEGYSDIPVIHNSSVHFSEILELQVHEMQDFSFLKGYAIEFVVSLFVFYPLVEAILFSGALGCGRLPFLGGRPREMKMEMQRMESKSKCASATWHEIHGHNCSHHV